MEIQIHVKTIMITGSTRGIGFGLAAEFLKRDFNVTSTVDRKAQSIKRSMI